jgi:hypothetical protein
MKSLKSALVSYVFPSLAVLVVVFGCEKLKSSNEMYMCNHQFALCTSALCVPMPGDATKAICTCDVQEGASMSTVPCDRLKPSTDGNGIQTVYSTFSSRQFTEGKQGMKCPSGTPWSWCLNKRCTVDPTNPDRAICTCDVVRTGEWMTLGGNCDTSTCKTGYWSGAALQDFEQGNIFLAKALGLETPVVKWCEAK